MFKKNLLSFLAVALAVVAVFATSNSSATEAKDGNAFADFYWRLDAPASPLQGSSYSSISLSAYNAISCSPGPKVCKLRSSAATLPANMTDADGDDIPDVTGTIVAAPTKN